jgi:hypothetical protein
MSAATLDRPTTAPDEQPGRDEVVAHEVGHVLAAWHHFLPGRSVSATPVVGAHGTAHGQTDVDLSGLSNHAAAQVLLAGPLAAFRDGHNPPSGCVEDYQRVLRLGHHPGDQNLAREVWRVLAMHAAVADELAIELELRGTLGEDYLSDHRFGWRYHVQGAALASLVLPDELAREYREQSGWVTAAAMVGSPADGERLLAALRTAWRRAGRGDWHGRRWAEAMAANVKDAVERLPVARTRKARRST